MQCKLKGKCTSNEDELYNCWDDNCDSMIHQHCCDVMLTKFDIPETDRPSKSETTDADEPIVFCKKGCFLKWKTAQKREAKAAAGKLVKTRKIPWEEDGSLDVLMEWLTTEGNYAEYCGSTNNKGKSKSQFHRELAILIKEKKPDSDRNEKDVENKITSLERQFRVAADWANNTGQGVDNPGDFQAAVLKRCPLYDELDPIMGDRPNAKPLSTNKDSEDDNDEDEDENNSTDSVDSDFRDAATAVEESTEKQNTEKVTKKQISSVSSVSSKSTGSSKRRLKASTSKKQKKGRKGNTTDVDTLLAGYLGVDDDKHSSDCNNNSFKQLRVHEIEAKEREANARILEAEAMSGKVKSESIILDIQAKASLLRERKRLKEEGICQEEIDQLLPLPSKNTTTSTTSD